MMTTNLLLYCLPLFAFSFATIRYEMKLPIFKMRDNEIPVDKVNFEIVNILTDPRFQT